MPQLTYDEKPEVGLPGMAYGDPALNQVDTARNAEASANIPFGVAVKRDTVQADLTSVGAGEAKLPTSGSDKIWGFAQRSMHNERPSNDSEGIKPDDLFPVIVQGKVLVTVSGAFVAGGDVFIRHGGTGQLGSVLAADDSTNASKLTNARFGTSGGDGDVGVIELFGVIGAMT